MSRLTRQQRGFGSGFRGIIVFLVAACYTNLRRPPPSMLHGGCGYCMSERADASEPRPAAVAH